VTKTDTNIIISDNYLPMVEENYSNPYFAIIVYIGSYSIKKNDTNKSSKNTIFSKMLICHHEFRYKKIFLNCYYFLR